MFERFTHRARRVVVLAQEEARTLNHNHIGTEHLLLGLIREGEGVAPRALESLRISLEAVRRQVEEIIGQGQEVPAGHIPFTPRAKKVLELALREAHELKHHYLGTEHILLGLIREGEGVAAQVLTKLGGDLDRVREEVMRILTDHPEAQEPFPRERRPPWQIESPGEVEGEGVGPRCPTCRAWVGQGGQATSTVIEVPDATGGESRSVVFVFCGRCGRMLAASVPGVPGTQ